MLDLWLPFEVQRIKAIFTVTICLATEHQDMNNLPVVDQRPCLIRE